MKRVSSGMGRSQLYLWGKNTQPANKNGVENWALCDADFEKRYINK